MPAKKKRKRRRWPEENIQEHWKTEPGEGVQPSAIDYAAEGRYRKTGKDGTNKWRQE